MCYICHAHLLDFFTDFDKPLIHLRKYGAPGRIRTSDPLVRSQILYPTELRARKLAEKEGFEPSMGFCPILP
jgi:hypothetical protein